MTITVHKQESAPLGTLQLAGYNPRSISDAELRKLMRSIDEFGCVEPIVARREDRLVIGGHQRLTAMGALLREKGLDEKAVSAAPVPVVFVDGLSDDRAKALNVALNKIQGSWDYDKLAELFDSMGEEIDPLLTGFSEDEMNDILELGAPPDLTAEDPDDLDVDAELAAKARKFQFEVATDADAEACRAVLAAHGMTGPGNAGKAFVSVCQAAKK